MSFFRDSRVSSTTAPGVVLPPASMQSCIEQRPVRMACYIGEVKSIPYGLSTSYCGFSPGVELTLPVRMPQVNI